MSEAVEAVLSKLKGVKPAGPGKWMALCPGHDDHEPSLSIGIGDDGRVLLKCHSDCGCTFESICKALRIDSRDLRPPKTRRAHAAPACGKIVKTYDYVDENGKMLYQVVRYDPKDFSQRRPEGQGWVWGLSDGEYWQGKNGDWYPVSKKMPVAAPRKHFPDVRRVLYRLPELLKADPQTPRFIVEGEKDADNLVALGLVATTCPQGAGKWAKLSDDEALHSRRVVILPDKDDPGRRHAEDVAGRLHDKAAEVKVLELPGPGKDVSDWISARNGTDKTAIRAELLSLVEAAPLWRPSERPQEASDDAGLDGEIARLAALSILAYESCRKSEAARLGVRTSILDRLVKQARGEDGRGQGHALDLPELEPWPEPVNGGMLLDELAAAFLKYIVLPAHGAVALALWTIFAHSLDCFEIAPRLALISPEKRCGKTRTITVLTALVPRPLPTSNISVAAVFRSVEKGRPTLLLDEADTYIHGSDELRGILNSGHTRAGAYVVRVVGDDLEPRVFSTWAAMAFGAIGHLPDTQTDRSIILPMVRKTPGDKVQRLRQDRTEDLHVLGRKVARWAADHADALRAADPDMPARLDDRAVDNWRALVAIADLAGGDWPDRARAAAVSLSGAGVVEDASVRIRLLEDLRDMFGKAGVGRLASKDICAHLAEMEDRPWPEWKHGKPITAQQVAALLRPFKITPKNIRDDGEVIRGYIAQDLQDAISRYLLPSQTATPLQLNNDAEIREERSATSSEPVADEKARIPLKTLPCSGVANCKEGARSDDSAEVVRRVRAGQAVPYQSGLLGEEILIVPDHFETPPGERRVTYRLDELGELSDKGLTADDLQGIHAVKHAFNGVVVPPERGCPR